MEAPPDIRKRGRRETLTDLMRTMKLMTATKAASAGMEHISGDEWKLALEDFREARELFTDLEDNDQVSNMLSMEGLCHFALDELDQAAEVMRLAIALKEGGCQPEGKATDLLGLGEILLKMGDLEGALSSFEESAKIFEDLGLENDRSRARSAVKRAKEMQRK